MKKFPYTSYVFYRSDYFRSLLVLLNTNISCFSHCEISREDSVIVFHIIFRWFPILFTMQHIVATLSLGYLINEGTRVHSSKRYLYPPPRSPYTSIAPSTTILLYSPRSSEVVIAFHTAKPIEQHFMSNTLPPCPLKTLTFGR